MIICPSAHLHWFLLTALWVSIARDRRQIGMLRPSSEQGFLLTLWQFSNASEKTVNETVVGFQQGIHVFRLYCFKIPTRMRVVNVLFCRRSCDRPKSLVVTFPCFGVRPNRWGEQAAFFGISLHDLPFSLREVCVIQNENRQGLFTRMLKIGITQNLVSILNRPLRSLSALPRSLCTYA